MDIQIMSQTPFGCGFFWTGERMDYFGGHSDHVTNAFRLWVGFRHGTLAFNRPSIMTSQTPFGCGSVLDLADASTNETFDLSQTPFGCGSVLDLADASTNETFDLSQTPFGWRSVLDKF
ncbi:MAG: hypothetical protein ACOX9C_03830 [Kiritimatiellia bacterium]